MGLLSYTELCELVEQGVINAPLENVNGASIDLTLSANLLIESNLIVNPEIDLKSKQNINNHQFIMDENGYVIAPGEFLLAATNEIFSLPDDIAAEFKLKSSQARNGLFHAIAGHADPGFNGSNLTLEFHNVNRYHSLIIKPNMPCGQMLFYRVKPVPKERSYSTVGQYNGALGVIASKGIR